MKAKEKESLVRLNEASGYYVEEIYNDDTEAVLCIIPDRLDLGFAISDEMFREACKCEGYVKDFHAVKSMAVEDLVHFDREGNGWSRRMSPTIMRPELYYESESLAVEIIRMEFLKYILLQDGREWFNPAMSKELTADTLKFMMKKQVKTTFVCLLKSKKGS